MTEPTAPSPYEHTNAALLMPAKPMPAVVGDTLALPWGNAQIPLSSCLGAPVRIICLSKPSYD